MGGEVSNKPGRLKEEVRSDGVQWAVFGGGKTVSEFVEDGVVPFQSSDPCNPSLSGTEVGACF